jgi:hypothetical protein
MKFILLRVRNALVFHGDIPDNQEIVEEVRDADFVDKPIAVDRIQSATEKSLLVTSSHGRTMNWEYDDTLASVQARLAEAGLVIA